MVNETVGKIEYSKYAMILAWIGLIFGTACTITCIYVLAGNMEVSADTKFGCGVFIPVGLLYAFICGGMLFMKQRAFIKVDSDGVYGFCQFGLSLNCKFSDIADVHYNAGKELCIELKNGKRYFLMHLVNAVHVGHAIIERMGVARKKYLGDREAMKVEYHDVEKKKQFFGILGISCFFMIIAEIVLAGILTGWKDMADFSRTDWIAFDIVAGFALVTVGGLIWLVRICMDRSRKLDRVKRALYANIFYRVPVLTDGAEHIFLDDEYEPHVRVVAYANADGEGAYFIVEEINKHFEIEVLGEPVEYASMDDLLTDLNEWFEIRKYRFDSKVKNEILEDEK